MSNAELFKNLPPIKIESDELFRSHNVLPPLPQIVSRIQELMQSENINVSEIAKLVSVDVALSAQILKIVNSAYYSLRKEISDLKIAIAFLGINEIYRIVLSLSVISSLKSGNENAIRDFWYRSYYTTLSVKLLSAKYTRFIDREELWSAALLSDIGSLVYLKFYPDHFKAIRELSQQKGILYSQAEAELKLPSSSVFGSLLSTYWKLPNSVKIACENHTYETLKELRSTDSNSDFKKIISLGCLCADFSMMELNADLKDNITHSIITTLDIKEQEFLLLMGEIRDQLLDVEMFMKALF
ncbi:MAG: HDOD domain-containing protein [Calditrichae bacterium]|nr:HDOD domain-containing protein [Calditrichota bacterium]MCB9059338.1 HDOD domain-containing protein [Calditrichia bacterium]